MKLIKKQTANSFHRFSLQQREHPAVSSPASLPSSAGEHTGISRLISFLLSAAQTHQEDRELWEAAIPTCSLCRGNRAYRSGPHTSHLPAKSSCLLPLAAPGRRQLPPCGQGGDSGSSMTVLPQCFCVFLYFPGPGGNRGVRRCAGGFASEGAQRDRDTGAPPLPDSARAAPARPRRR